MGVPLSIQAIYPIALVAMSAPMLLVMYLRRARYAHHGHASEA